MIRVVYFHIHVSCRCIYLAEPKSHACTLFKKIFWKMQVVGCQPLLFKKMSPQSTGMNGEWANKKCLQQTVPNLIGTDFMGVVFWRLAKHMQAQHERVTWFISYLLRYREGREFRYACHTLFHLQAKTGRKKQLGVATGDLRQINNYRKVKSGGY